MFDSHFRPSYLFPALAFVCVTVLGTSVLSAGDLANYREFQFGMSLSVAAKQAGVNPNEAKVVHQRPALIQEMEWQPRALVLADPIKDGLLSFYNGELFRIVIAYDRYKVEGMTPEDMTEAISATYGVAVRPKAEIAFHSNYGEMANVIARWENPEYSYNLVRTGDRSSFALVLYSKRLSAAAEKSIVEAVRLEAQEAPQRAADLQKKKDQESRVLLDNARSVNRPNFRP